MLLPPWPHAHLQFLLAPKGSRILNPGFLTSDLPTVTGYLQLSSSDDRDPFVDDLFGAAEEAARTLQAPLRHSFVDLSPSIATPSTASTFLR